MAKKALIPAGDLGTAVTNIPTMPPFNAPAVASQLAVFTVSAQKAFDAAQRAVIETPESAEKGTEFLAGITKKLAEIDEQRKLTTGKLDQMVKGLNALFNKGPAAKLEQAKVMMQAKLGGYVRRAREKAEADAEAERQRIAAEAAQQAAAAIEEGDTAGAIETLQAAASVEVEAEKPVIRGATSVLATTKRKVGRVTDLRAFLKWVTHSDLPMALAAMGGVSVGQRELNQLAAAVFAYREATGDAAYSIPGVTVELEESYGAR
jgi:hypothetical protein